MEKINASFTVDQIMSDVRLIYRNGVPVFVPYVFLTEKEKEESDYDLELYRRRVEKELEK